MLQLKELFSEALARLLANAERCCAGHQGGKVPSSCALILLAVRCLHLACCKATMLVGHQACDTAGT